MSWQWVLAWVPRVLPPGVLPPAPLPPLTPPEPPCGPPMGQAVDQQGPTAITLTSPLPSMFPTAATTEPNVEKSNDDAHAPEEAKMSEMPEKDTVAVKPPPVVYLPTPKSALSKPVVKPKVMAPMPMYGLQSHDAAAEVENKEDEEVVLVEEEPRFSYSVRGCGQKRPHENPPADLRPQPKLRPSPPPCPPPSCPSASGPAANAACGSDGDLETPKGQHWTSHSKKTTSVVEEKEESGWNKGWKSENSGWEWNYGWK